MTEETHAEFMARIQAMSSATHRPWSIRAKEIASPGTRPMPFSGTRQIHRTSRSVAVLEPPEIARAERMAIAGLGWEDVRHTTGLSPERCREIVFGRRAGQ